MSKNDFLPVLQHPDDEMRLDGHHLQVLGGTGVQVGRREGELIFLALRFNVDLAS